MGGRMTKYMTCVRMPEDLSRSASPLATRGVAATASHDAEPGRIQTWFFLIKGCA